MAGIGQQCELRIWQERPRKDGRLERVLKSGLDEESIDEDRPFAVVVTQVFSEKNALEHSKLQINSPHLLHAFRKVIKTYPTVPSDFASPFEMVSPFQMLYHYWDDLDSYQASVTDDTARMHVNLLLDFLKVELGRDKTQCDGMVRKGQMSYSWLWTLYRPSDLQYHVQNGHAWLLRVEKTAYEENTKMGKYFEVHCTYTDYDGINVGQAAHVFRILQKKHFAAENPATIRKLPVYPRKFLDDQLDLEKHLQARGRRFLEMQGVLVRSYDGLAQYLKEPPEDFYDPDMGDWPGVWLSYTETGRVVLDRKMFREENHLEQVPVHPSLTDDGSGLGPVLCPPFVYGYSLSLKEWCKFYVDNIKEINWKSNAFDTLILGDRQKRVLRALVSSHLFPANSRDQMDQKGKGLVVLLHGTPGSGKTLTAESAAEITEKALFSTTIGELNKYNYPAFFERKLKSVLHYATTWKAIVLLDEADVFLEARQDASTGDAAERNALVAVFLKHLEYFSGIVFLTSNRVGVFDQAMKSRIHLAIEYCPPELEMRRLIWTQCLKSIPADETDIRAEEAIDCLIHDTINGREISNSVNTARTLARFEGSPLELRHLEMVLQVRREFDSSIDRKLKALTLAESRQGAMAPPHRQNSLLMAAEEHSQWLP